MPRKTVPVVLSEAELNRLQEWIRAGSTPRQVVLRARVVLAAAQGQQDRQIALALHVRRRTAALWGHRLREQGIGCVWEILPGRGRKARYGAAKVAEVIETTLRARPSGSTHWSTRSLAQAQGVSKNTIQRLVSPAYRYGLHETLRSGLIDSR